MDMAAVGTVAGRAVVGERESRLISRFPLCELHYEKNKLKDTIERHILSKHFRQFVAVS